MRVLCIDNSAATLPSHYHARFTAKATPRYRWPLEVGKEYVAGAMGLFRGCMLYLVQTDARACPEFVPSPLFRLVDGKMSSRWRVWTTHDFTEYTVECVIGYPELTDGTCHLDNLLDGDSEAIQLFARRLLEMERELRDI
jgi:hypothetical protein